MDLTNSEQYIYFIGIGGVSMSGLAEILVKKGIKVSGSDMNKSKATENLESKGIKVDIGHKKENISSEITLVVYTAAISKDNPEYLEAIKKGITLVTRGEMLGEIMREFNYSIGVSGTHGKTTTTSMVSEILLAKDLDPTIAVGGILPSIGSNLRIGESSNYFVAEACEYHNSFLELTPYVGIILNIEEDHLDFFSSLEEIRESFSKYIKGIDSNGILIINSEIDNVDELIKDAKCKVEKFSVKEEISGEWQGRNIVHHDDGSCEFTVYYNEEVKGVIQLKIPGVYNISNALASIACSNYLGIEYEYWKNGLSEFLGTNRRFQRKGIKDGIEIIDDYAHHPTEIKVTLEAVKSMKANKKWCIFQPHTYTRTKFLFDEFTMSFKDVDEVIIVDIFPAREVFDPSITSKMLADGISATGKSVNYINNFNDVKEFLNKNCVSGDLIITVGAGDVYKIGEDFLV